MFFNKSLNLFPIFRVKYKENEWLKTSAQHWKVKVVCSANVQKLWQLTKDETAAGFYQI